MTASDGSQVRRASLLSRAIELAASLPRALRIAAVLGCMLVLWWSSSRTPTPSPPDVWFSLMHNAMHVVAYAGLGAACWLAGSRRPVGVVQPWRSRGAWLVAAGYGAVDELHQSFVPGRVASPSDWLTDAASAALVIVLLRGCAGVAPRWRRAALGLTALCVGAVLLATFGPW